MPFYGLSLGAMAKRWGLCLVAALCAAPASAQLRIVSYNTATGSSTGTQTLRSGGSTVLQAIGAESRGGVARPVDVLLLQEQFWGVADAQSVSSLSIVSALNTLYGPGVYAAGTLRPQASSPDYDGGGPGIVYNTQTVTLVSEARVGSVSGSSQPRSTMRYQLQPVGYGTGAQFYAYSNHYKAGSTQDDQDRRYVEALRLRINSDALGEGTPIIYAGDYNTQSSSEDSYQKLLEEGPGQAVDPIATPGNWTSSSAFKAVHTQSPAASGVNGLIGGGVDDRFDFQLVTAELMDDEGMSLIPGSYHAFGNNGSHACCNSSITSGSGASPAVLSALTTASDHLPVVADYQLPAILLAEADFDDQQPLEFALGQAVQLAYRVRNAAPVAVSVGADELDYTLVGSGALVGSASGSVLAATAGALVSVTLDTSTPGLKSGLVSVSTTSPGGPVSLVELPLSWSVVAPLLTGDYNRDGLVDAADYVVWRDTLGEGVALAGEGADGDLDLTIGPGDYDAWVGAFGAPAASSSVAAPEPSGLAVLAPLVGALLGGRRYREEPA